MRERDYIGLLIGGIIAATVFSSTRKEPSKEAPAASNAYDQAVASATSAYDQAVASATSAYDQAVASAWKLYGELAKWNLYDQAVFLAQSIYDKASALAQNIFDQAIASATSAYDQAVAQTSQTEFFEPTRKLETSQTQFFEPAPSAPISSILAAEPLPPIVQAAVISVNPYQEATIAKAQIETIAGIEAQVVESTQYVTVTGTGLPEQQTLQAAAQLTQETVISSETIKALGGEITNTFTAKIGTPLGDALNTQLVALKEDNRVYASGIGGYDPTGTPIWLLTPQQSFFGLENIGGFWYRVSTSSRWISYTGLPIIDRSGNVTQAPAKASVSNL